jgi:Rrf2 family protein
VNISAKTEYACIAVVELAAHYATGEPVRIRRIAEAHGIPSRFLVQILLQLKSAGLVNSTRGAAGGYQLARDPQQISLGEVMSVVDGRNEDISTSATVQTPVSRALVSVWRDVARTQHELLDAITFAELLERAQGPEKDMYYI